MRRIIGIMAGIFLLLGMAALLYHPISSWVAKHRMTREITTFRQSIGSTQAQPSESGLPYQDLLTEMQSYNTELYENGQSSLTDAWSYEQAAFDFTEYGLSNQVMGILCIPAMEEELPVYLGATEENMARGVAVLGQTSMPVGGANTNCVIVGHRGYKGTPFFREIEQLQAGDLVYLTTYWGEKTYQVESTAIILPDDVEAILIQADRELLTLVTCHPYTISTHRYVVYCSAVEETEDSTLSPIDAEPDVASGKNGNYTGLSSSQNRIRLERWLPFSAIPLVVLSVVILIWPQTKDKSQIERRSDRDEKNTP